MIETVNENCGTHSVYSKNNNQNDYLTLFRENLSPQKNNYYDID